MADHERMAGRLAISLLVGAALVFAGCGGDGSVAPAETAVTATISVDSRVVGVADGDTAFIEIDGVRETVRLVGIDAPESDGPYRDPGCFGDRASDRLRELLPVGVAVRVETDPGQRSSRDRFDRLLGYVFRQGDEISINQRLVAEGMAQVFVFRDDPFSQTVEFRRSEDEARSNGLGLWGACGRSGQGPAAAPASDRDCPADAPIKGNLPSAIYHSPGDESYEMTNPERCFADARAAEAEGFRPAAR